MLGAFYYNTMITRTPFLTTLPVDGSFRYKNTLQLLPPKTEDPNPPFKMGWYGGTLVVSFEESVADVRTKDYWAHDHLERIRFDLLKSKANKETWLNAVIQDMSMNRRLGIEKEALNLLQVISNNVFRKQTSSHDWFLDPETKKVTYGQLWYPSFLTDSTGDFLENTEKEIQLVDAHTHYSKHGIGIEDTAITLPSNIDTQLDAYFNLSSKRKINFGRACNLFRSAQEVWPTSKSLSLAAHVFAIDALCHVDDPKPEKCPECQNLLSDQTCSKCGGPKFGITRRFRDFVSQFVDDLEEQRFSKRMFQIRSAIAHQGDLLRMDEYGTEFNVGGTDAQHSYSYGVAQITRKVLLGWLASTQYESN